MALIAVKSIFCHNHMRMFSDRFSSIRIYVQPRKIATRNVNPDSMPGFKQITGWR
jgi:hypothetical protein